MLKRRQAWFEDQLDLDPERLVFIDETWAFTNMARRYPAWAAPAGRRAPWTLEDHDLCRRIAQERARRAVVLDGPINREAFETYVARVLVPELVTGDVVIMDNLSSTRGRGPRDDRGGGLKPALPAALGPDFNPIENAFAKLKGYADNSLYVQPGMSRIMCHLSASEARCPKQ